MENYNFGPNVIYFALGIPESRPAGAFWADKIVFWVRKASRRGLLGKSNCILIWKSVPQGPFGSDDAMPGGRSVDQPITP